MLHNQPLTLKLAGRKDFIILMTALFVLVMVSAILSPRPVLLITLAILLFGAVWMVSKSDLFNMNHIEYVSVIYPDGQVRVNSGSETIFEGFLGERQWCSRWFAVLQIANGDDNQTLLIPLWKQRQTDDFRRLVVWLRQGFCTDGGDRPANRV